MQCLECDYVSINSIKARDCLLFLCLMIFLHCITCLFANCTSQVKICWMNKIVFMFSGKCNHRKISKETVDCFVTPLLPFPSPIHPPSLSFSRFKPINGPDALSLSIAQSAAFHRLEWRSQDGRTLPWAPPSQFSSQSQDAIAPPSNLSFVYNAWITCLLNGSD